MMTFIYFFTVLACTAICAALGALAVSESFSKEDIENRPAVARLAYRRITHSLIMAVLALSFLVSGAVGYPWFRVWSARMEGAAELARAENNRQIKIAEANATAEAALKLAIADVRRAQGVRQANEIIAGQLGGPDNYLRFLSIEALKEVQAGSSSKIIYVPTEANLPITEAVRLQGE